MNMTDLFFEELKAIIYAICKRVSDKEITIEQGFSLIDKERNKLVYKYQNGGEEKCSKL